jgi:ATP sulfurylase
MPKDLIAPHGGTLINRVVANDQYDAVLARAQKAPIVALSEVALSDLH